MDPVWLLLLLPLAAAGGWLMATHDKTSSVKSQGVPDAYFKGLSFLLNEQPDKALKVFLEVAEVDDETIEMHMALGNLFRRRGEIEKATRIHQNLVARSDLEDSLRSMALFELAQDYFKAGLFGTAEDLFRELHLLTEYKEQAGRFLLQIYDQEKEWLQAINVAENLDQISDHDYSETIAHFYCELAEISIGEGNNSEAENHLESAFQHNPRCLRAVIQSGRLASMRGNHANAIAIWRGIEYWSPLSLGEVVGHIVNGYLALGDKKSLKNFLEGAIEMNPDPRILSALVDLTSNDKGEEAGEMKLLELVRQYPSLHGMYMLMKGRAERGVLSQQDKDYSIVANLLQEVVERGRNYHCTQCGFQSNTLHWQCPGCKGWDTAHRQLIYHAIGGK